MPAERMKRGGRARWAKVTDERSMLVASIDDRYDRVAALKKKIESEEEAIGNLQRRLNEIDH